jgi:hypothetical protein
MNRDTIVQLLISHLRNCQIVAYVEDHTDKKLPCKIICFNHFGNLARIKIYNSQFMLVGYNEKLYSMCDTIPLVKEKIDKMLSSY